MEGIFGGGQVINGVMRGLVLYLMWNASFILTLQEFNFFFFFFSKSMRNPNH